MRSQLAWWTYVTWVKSHKFLLYTLDGAIHTNVSNGVFSPFIAHYSIYNYVKIEWLNTFPCSFFKIIKTINITQMQTYFL